MYESQKTHLKKLRIMPSDNQTEKILYQNVRLRMYMLINYSFLLQLFVLLVH